MLPPLLAVAHVTATLVPLSIVASEGATDNVGVCGITEKKETMILSKPIQYIK